MMEKEEEDTLEDWLNFEVLVFKFLVITILSLSGF